MIISQTPLRIGLLGGGTDLPGYYREHGGRVINCAIDKYVYVIVKQRFDNAIYVNYSKKEIVSRVDDLEHELVREAMHMAGVVSGVEITTLADIPSGGGSGLGSSSAVAVGLLQARQAGSVHCRARRDPRHPVRARGRGRGPGARTVRG
jgi:D-glycero-alpha-D-manno-heptose-7-phosphate kinase